MGSTVGKLSEITDEGLFERLATAILRQARPEYSGLLLPGVNAEGKTVKSPLDGIYFVPAADPPHLIAVHHTTCKRDALKAKWLYDPTSVSPRSRRGATKPPGDLIKTANIVAEERMRQPSLRATLILTTNQEPAEDLDRETFAAGKTLGIEVDIWSVSRLAHELDNTPSGQWLRYRFLGIEQERLSRELLAKLSRESLRIHRPDENPAVWVSRDLDRAVAGAVRERDLTFVIGESGVGKSVSCYKHLKEHVAAGGYGLVLSLPFAEVGRDQGYRQPGGVSRRGGHGSAVAWQHLNLLGEYDFSDEKLARQHRNSTPKIGGLNGAPFWG